MHFSDRHIGRPERHFTGLRKTTPGTRAGLATSLGRGELNRRRVLDEHEQNLAAVQSGGERWRFGTQPHRAPG